MDFGARAEYICSRGHLYFALCNVRDKVVFQRRESNLQAVKRIIFTVLYYLKGGNNI
jgi:hypothetical protein